MLRTKCKFSDLSSLRRWDCLSTQIKVHYLQIGHLTFSGDLIVRKSVRIQKKLSVYLRRKGRITRLTRTHFHFRVAAFSNVTGLIMAFLTFLEKSKIEFRNFSLAANPMEGNGDMLFCKIDHSSFSIILSSNSVNSLNWVYSDVSFK